MRYELEEDKVRHRGRVTFCGADLAGGVCYAGCPLMEKADSGLAGGAHPIWGVNWVYITRSLQA